MKINNAVLAHEYRNGASLKELARKYGRCHSAILYRLQRYGCERRINGAPRGNQNWKGKKRMIERTIQTGDRVVENKTGLYGDVKRCLWLVDLKVDTPALAACIVRFDDGREVQRSEAQLTFVRRVTTYFD